MRLGLVSDSHGLADPALPRLLAGCDLILHAGDLERPEVLTPLEAVAPVRAVRGNNDHAPGVRSLPEVLRVDVAEVAILLLHEIGAPHRLHPQPRRLVRSARPQVVVYGHSHAPYAGVHDGVLYVNPGSAGPRRFSLPRCAALLHLDGLRARVEWLPLEPTGRASTAPPLEVTLSPPAP